MVKTANQQQPKPPTVSGVQPQVLGAGVQHQAPIAPPTNFILASSPAPTNGQGVEITDGETEPVARGGPSPDSALNTMRTSLGPQDIVHVEDLGSVASSSLDEDKAFTAAKAALDNLGKNVQLFLEKRNAITEVYLKGAVKQTSEKYKLLQQFINKYDLQEDEVVDATNLLFMMEEMVQIGQAALKHPAPVPESAPRAAKEEQPSTSPRKTYWHEEMDQMDKEEITRPANPSVPFSLIPPKPQPKPTPIEATDPAVISASIVQQHYYSREILGDLPTFSGGTTEYLAWKNLVYPLLRKDTRGVIATLNTLKKRLKGEALAKVERVTAWGSDPITEAFAILDKHYNQPGAVLTKLKSDVQHLEPPKVNDPDSLDFFITSVQRTIDGFHAAQQPIEDQIWIFMDVFAKLPLALQQKWIEQKKPGVPDRILDLLSFLEKRELTLRACP